MVMSNLARYGFGGFGTSEMVKQGTPVLVGGGSALVVAAAARGFGEPGSWIERRAGTLGATGGVITALLSKQGGAALAAAIIVGLAIEGLEALTEAKVAG
jgi:hypothetical protein